jgi:hypothetical protein
MIQLGLAEQVGVGIRLTPLGQVCGSSQLAFKSALSLMSRFRKFRQRDKWRLCSPAA